ncbi:hypothetical protein AB0H83_04655 [Dactylosporangium sp. NPDC050688]|uniref:hypothetical protein n=1 Tax=Dactylosporangium sp. NPDC050688 TaxID=3157217 RepID=UPI0033FC6965
MRRGLLAATVRRLTGLAFDAGAIIDFTGLKRVVDAVGRAAPGLGRPAPLTATFLQTRKH